MEPHAEVVLANRAYLDHEAPPGAGPAPPASAGGLLEALRPVVAPWSDGAGTTWIGPSRGRHDRAWTDDAGYELLDTDVGPLRHRRLYLEPDEWTGHYAASANGFLWPLFHLVRERLPEATGYYPAPETPSDGDWAAYRAVNAAFARAASEEEARSCWVHDYQLGLAPLALREAGWRGRIGFFLHTPFPDLGVAAPYLDSAGEERLREWVAGVLGADVAGFQTPSDVARFTAAAERLCSAERAHGGVLVDGRLVRLAAFPVGIDTAALAEVARTAELPEEVAALRGRGLPLVVGLERADYTKGIPERIDAVARALEDGVTFAYAGYASPTRPGVAAYDRLAAECDRRAERAAAIAAERGLPFLHRQRALRWSEVVALQREASVLFTSSLADGMNLVPVQTAMAQSVRPAAERGVILVGRDAGAAETYAGHEQDGLVPVDPLDTEATARALTAALAGEPGRISDRLVAAVRDHDAASWGRAFLATLLEA